MVHKAEAGVKRGDYSMISKMQMFGVFLTAATTGIPVALAVIFGPSLINTILAHTPEWLTNGLTVAGGLLPAVGIGLLLRYLPAKEYFSYLVIGFVMSVYLKMPLLGVALIGAAIALIIYKKNSQNVINNTVVNTIGGMDEDE